MNITSLPLHDAVLSGINICWEADRCDFRVSPVGGEAHLLVFESFTNLALPNKKHWGRSCSINTVQESKPGIFEVELQSGDVLRVEARHWSYRAVAGT
ncbi:hypothetical protein [Janthinobacterium sp. B9-8]|uniref:hypothetical protein n=1 Tax=Janthinobacterium sp. B9-8 TaxID=1236179 RepID=UPI00061D04AF|nr:hypothetical protein [Janthinobacterium sp. B9-8]AMC33877.1 hypothetical protein VN23_04305 [Janthinobacterium sp. B9-8]